MTERDALGTVLDYLEDAVQDARSFRDSYNDEDDQEGWSAANGELIGLLRAKIIVGRLRDVGLGR